jgi:hypothetical protein
MMILLRGAVARMAAVLPVMFLVVIAGVMGLLGLAFRADGREYAQRVCQSALLAACALMAGRPLDLPSVLAQASNKRRPASQKARATAA